MSAAGCVGIGHRHVGRSKLPAGGGQPARRRIRSRGSWCVPKTDLVRPPSGVIRQTTDKLTIVCGESFETIASIGFSRKPMCGMRSPISRRASSSKSGLAGEISLTPSASRPFTEGASAMLVANLSRPWCGTAPCSRHLMSRGCASTHHACAAGRPTPTGTTLSSDSVESRASPTNEPLCGRRP